MPLYLYENPVTGATLEMVRPIHLRDRGVPEGFVRIVTAPGVVVAHKGPPSMRDGVLAGYREAELRDGSRFKSGFSKKEILEAWK